MYTNKLYLTTHFLVTIFTNNVPMNLAADMQQYQMIPTQ